ncbi:metallophosphoesterase [Marinithermus hydrothermalis]|uniref:Metallophosphoesterase n=1 Tax=Marinithermus hydrothermalis (strain DSM 14884 / JCM 11576 / T1) TaxID=869210 RepID=F2NMM1_MARHT|nr:metallophosphoesterase [Marinithermus hydrothermalis]AEB12191.1 metallophosphoesterase [Marinithermus hydrothermalis DSM 14884]
MRCGVDRFQLTRHTRTLAGLTAPVRVVHLSDLHYGPWIRKELVTRWVEAALREAPDLVVITGDFVDAGLRDGIEGLIQALDPLRAPLGVWGVWGNHDRSRFNPLDPLREALALAGVRMLENHGVQLRPDLFLAGVDDLWRGRPDPEAALAGWRGGARLLLSHNPDLLAELRTPVELVLSGHTHGGQVCLPGIGAIHTGSRYGRRFVAGWVEAPQRAFISRGLGVSALPLRWNCPPEIAVHELAPCHRSPK